MKKWKYCILILTILMCLVLPSSAANITATVSPSTVAHGDKIFINGTAEGQPQSVAIWILGKNFANRDTVAVNIDGSFSYEVTQQTTEALNSGQYFVVVQHPEMNGVYDIDGCGSYVCLYTQTTIVSLFKISGPGSLQGSDAADALVTAINQPNIDDTGTKLQFLIKPNVTATVSPSTVAQGDKIFINGTAEGQPQSVAIWILGKNFANRDTVAVNVDGSFSYEIKQAVTMSLNSGQYFVVVQHPGTNGVYDLDICPTNPVGSMYVCDYAVGGPGPISVFKLSGPGSLQGFDAAEALVQGINKPYVDDTYTELQFQIVSSSKIGIYKDGTWYLDTNGNGVWNGPQTDKLVTSFGMPSWTQVTGDWNGDGRTKIGIYKDGTWYLDMNGNGAWDGTTTDRLVTAFGQTGWTPIVGDWNGDTKTEIGIYKDGTWYLDMNGNGAWDGTSPDKLITSFGQPGWTQIVGKWT